jgi:alkylation response protein AidB-like acyl-CoA dehydrogenase
MRFVLRELAALETVRSLPGCEEATSDLVDAVLEEAARFAGDVLAPLNGPGDRQGSRLENGVVRTPDGFADAYRLFVDAGWPSLSLPPRWGGQGLPCLLATAVGEMWTAANMAFNLCPMLTLAVAEFLAAHGSDALKAIYLPRLVSGAWAGTMNLTEPDAGSDLSRIRTRAIPADDHYRIIGQKIYITYGDHDLAPNIIHMVLARTPDGPPGIRGLSLFLVPKILPDTAGNLLVHNDVRCVSLEHKLGIRASPTAVMAYGDSGGAKGFLVGEENRGIDLMFSMMNAARLAVGLEGVGIADRAFQRARSYAEARVQGRPVAGPGADAGGTAVPIAFHPDVQRMLMVMKSQSEAARALAYSVAAATDLARLDPNPETRRDNQALVDLLTPVVKAWCTDIGIAVADTGIQVHGGMGYIEESGAPQHLRDARIAAIYEGTNGIQANDLVGRKVARDGGRAVAALIERMRQASRDLDGAGEARVQAIAPRLESGIDDLSSSTLWLVDHFPAEPNRVLAGAAHYLRLMGIVTGGWLMARAAGAAVRRMAEGDGDPAFLEGKILSARFFAGTLLAETAALKTQFLGAGDALAGLDTRQHL